CIATSILAVVLMCGDALAQMETGRGPVATVSHAAETRTMTAQRLYRQAEESLRRSDQQLRRGATLSCRESAIQGLHKIAQSIQQQMPDAPAIDDCQQSITAIREAFDFLGRFGSVDHEAVERCVWSHKSGILKDASGNPLRGVDKMQGMEAAERYLADAAQRLVRLCYRDEIGAQLLQQIARSYLDPSISQTAGDWKDDQLGSQMVAMTLTRCVVQCDVPNAELYSSAGRSFARFGLIPEARDAMKMSLAIQPDHTTADQLRQIAIRMGDDDAVQIALKTLATTPAPPSMRVPPVTRLSPTQFAALSPRSNLGGAPSTMPANTMTMPTQISGSVPPRSAGAASVAANAAIPAAPTKRTTNNPLTTVARKISGLFR
ncbi:MAG: hypothetical protein AAFP90_11860, partial [Planctomycetota bacterium]